MKAPVSTTHSIVGGVMGAGIAAAGFSLISWSTMAKIAASWVISPVLGGVIAAAFLFAIKKSIVFKEDKVNAAKKYVPIFVALMSWAFVTYLTLKGLKKIWPQVVDILNFIPLVSIEMSKKPSFLTALTLGFVVAVLVYLAVKANETKRIKSTKKHIKRAKKVQYVKRDAIKKIVAAWIITVPAAAILAATLFYTIRGIML